MLHTKKVKRPLVGIKFDISEIHKKIYYKLII